jgi:signal peptidase I
MDTNLPQPIPVGPPPERLVSDPLNLPRKESGGKNIFATLAILIAAPIMALILTSFVFQSYEVFGPSMQQTLQNGDRLIVVKAPRTWSKIRRETFMPKRGQIVVFTKLDVLISSSDGNKQLIKRVIGLPGERVVVKDGEVTVYNKERPEGFQPDKEAAYGSTITKTGGQVDVVVGEDEVFVSGDNRDNSLDSRTFGPIKTKDIVGTAAFRFLPLNQSRSL